MRVISLLLTLLTLTLVCGCTKTSERTHARYELGQPFKFRPADPGGEYRVKWSATGEEPWQIILGSERVVAEGELLGFTMENNVLSAVAGESRFVISPVPRDAKVFVWSTEFVKGEDGKPATKPAE